MKALLYVRVSTKGQESDGFSLDAQLKLGREYAEKRGLQIARVWSGSESAWSPKKERVLFNQMIDYSKKHPEIGHIIFDITDRMTRNDTDKTKINILIHDFAKTIHFSRSNKQYDRHSGSDEVFMLDIEVAVAKKMSNDISKKTRMGQQEKAAQGIFPTIAPIGYLNNKVNKTIEVDAAKSPYITKAFKLMATGNYSIKMLNNTLRREGFSNRNGNDFAESSLHRVLHNSFYYGVFTIQDKTFQGTHEPLISKKLFDEVQAVMHSKDRVQPTLQRRDFPFANLASCGHCGCKVLGELKKERYVYYHCSYSKGRNEECTGYFTESRLADMFGEPVRNATIPDDILELFRRNLKEASLSSNMLRDNRIRTLQQEYEKINNRLHRLFDMRLDNEITEDAFKMKKTELENTLVNLKSELRSAERINPNFYEDGVRTLELSKSLYPQYLSVNAYGKAEILKTVASNYTLTDVSVCPTYRKPFSFWAKGPSDAIWGP